MRTRFLLGVVATSMFLGALPSPTLAQSATESPDTEARNLFEAGRLAFAGGSFERALSYFKQAYDLSHRAPLLYNIGVAADRLRHDQEALDAFEQYLREVPSAANREEVEGRVTAIRSALNARHAEEEARAVELRRAEEQQRAAEETRRAEEARRAREAEQSSQNGAATPPSPRELAEQDIGRSTNAPPTDEVDSGGGSVFTKWWFWTVVGVVVVGAGVGTAIALSGGGGTEAPIAGDDGRVISTLSAP